METKEEALKRIYDAVQKELRMWRGMLRQEPLGKPSKNIDLLDIEILIKALIESETKLRVVTCVYCGHQYEDGTPQSQDERLTAHIKVCEKHPMRAVEIERDEAIKKLEDEQRRKYGTPCSCEAWVATCKDLEDENEELKRENANLAAEIAAIDGLYGRED